MNRSGRIFDIQVLTSSISVLAAACCVCVSAVCMAFGNLTQPILYAIPLTITALTYIAWLFSSAELDGIRRGHGCFYSWLLLTLMISFGPIVNYFTNPEMSSFRPHFIGMFGFLSGISLAKNTLKSAFVHRVVVCTWLCLFILATVLCVCAYMIGASIVHEYVFLVVPVALPFLCTRSIVFRLAAIGIVLFWMLFGGKNTTFIIGFSVLACGGLYLMLHTRLKGLAPWITPLIFILACVGGLIGIDLIRNSGLRFSDGNINVRMYFYSELFDRFIDSPIYGNMFTADPTMVYPFAEIYGRKPNLPSHSDLLDVLAHGGLVAFILLSVIIVQILKSLYLAISQPAPTNTIWLASSSIACCGVVQCAFNPVMHRVTNGFCWWISIGMALYFMQYYAERRPNGT